MTYSATSRTSYTKVKDVEKFKQWVDTLDDTDLYELDSGEKHGKLYGLIFDGHGQIPSTATNTHGYYEEGEDEDLEFDIEIEKEIQPHIADGWSITFMSVFSEGNIDLGGYATIVTPTEIEKVNLRSMVCEKLEELGNPLATDWDYDRVHCVPLTKEIGDNLQIIIDYLGCEESDYEGHLDEGHPSENHIYHYIKQIESWTLGIEIPESVWVLVDYLKEDEKVSFHCYDGEPTDHIYYYIQQVEEYLDENFSRVATDTKLNVVGQYQQESEGIKRLKIENPELWSSFQRCIEASCLGDIVDTTDYDIQLKTKEQQLEKLG